MEFEFPFDTDRNSIAVPITRDNFSWKMTLDAGNEMQKKRCKNEDENGE